MKCKHCESSNFVKAGIANNLQRYKCNSCLRHFSNTPPKGKPKAMKDMALLMYVKSKSSCGMIGKILGVSKVTIYRCIRKEAIRIGDIKVPSDVTDVQIDKMWHYVNGKKINYGYGKHMM